MGKLFLANKKIVLVLAFATLGLYHANDALATCVKVLDSNGGLLGCALIEPYPPDVVLCNCSTATTSVNTNLNHHDVLLRVGDQDPLNFSLGAEKANGSWHIIPGEAGVNNAELTFTMPDPQQATSGVACSGSYSGPTGLPPNRPTDSDLGSGQCSYTERWEIPVVTCLGDSNLGHGNDCLGIDPDNPSGGPSKGKGKGKKQEAFRVNQTCGPSETPGRSVMTYQAFCEGELPDAGRGVGSTHWLADQGTPAGTPPAQFTNCTEAGADGDKCHLQNGGFPTFIANNGERLVDLTRCAELFPATTVNDQEFEAGQVLFVQQEWLGTCTSATQPPPVADQFIVCGDGSDALGSNCLGNFPRVVQAISRVCTSDLGGGVPGEEPPMVPFEWASSGGPENFQLQFGDGNFGDGFDNEGPVNNNLARICPPHVTATGGMEPAAVTTAAITNLNEAMTTAPPSQVVNLKCDGGSDSGVAWVQICGTPELDVQDIALTRPNGRTIDPDVAPALEGGQPAHDFEFIEAISGPCASGELDLRLKYFTCTVAENGLAQVISGKTVPEGECEGLQDHDTCPVGLQGQRSAPTAAGLTVILQDVMDVEVNNVKAIP